MVNCESKFEMNMKKISKNYDKLIKRLDRSEYALALRPLPNGNEHWRRTHQLLDDRRGAEEKLEADQAAETLELENHKDHLNNWKLDR